VLVWYNKNGIALVAIVWYENIFINAVSIACGDRFLSVMKKCFHETRMTVKGELVCSTGGVEFLGVIYTLHQTPSREVTFTKSPRIMPTELAFLATDASNWGGSGILLTEKGSTVLTRRRRGRTFCTPSLSLDLLLRAGFSKSAHSCSSEPDFQNLRTIAPQSRISENLRKCVHRCSTEPDL
jgi:hypothetical protein